MNNRSNIYRKVAQTAISFKNGSFNFTGVLGAGAYGEVHQVEYRRDPAMKFVCKSIKSSLLEPAGITEEIIMREIQNLERIYSQSIKPKSIVKYYDYDIVTLDTGGKIYYLYFEFLPNSLSKLIQDQINSNEERDFDRVYKYFRSLLNALAYMQILGLCHRDLKPDNILLDQNKVRIAVIDLGVSRDFSEKLHNILVTHYTMTIQGTPNYLAPELLQAHNAAEENVRHADPFKPDVFSFGLVMAELWLRRKIRNGLAVVREDVRSAYQEMRNIEVSLPLRSNYEKFRRIIKQCLKIDPDDRPNFLEIFKSCMVLDNFKKIQLYLIILEAENHADLNKFLNKGISIN